MNPCIQAPTNSASPHLLHILYALQQQYRHISAESINQVAASLDLPVSQVAAVVEFYAFFSREPCGRYHLLLSNCTSCGYLAGDTNLLLALSQRMGVNPGKTRADGLVSLGETSCIGLCDQGAALLVNSVPLVARDLDRVEQMAQLITTETPLAHWPDEWFCIQNRIPKPGLLLQHRWDAGAGLRAALLCGVTETLARIQQSGLRGRGGAGFNTGTKWQSCLAAPGAAHYVICNADEGEPGTFKDRVLLQHHADTMVEGMTLCAFVIGAEKGFVYLRGEYRYLLPHLQAVLAQRRQSGLLGACILGQREFNFDIELVVGAGAYICGEESALIESLEGKPGIPRVRPPFPVTQGYLGQPTVVNNVETFIAAAHIACRGSAWFAAVGTAASTGSKILSISGDCQSPGIYEYPFGVCVQQVLDDCGADQVQAVQVGGPSGTLLGKDAFNRALGFEDLSTGGSFLIFGQQRDLLTVNRNFARFFAHESCGFCTPCRVGTQLLKNGLDKIIEGNATPADVDEITRLGLLVNHRSHCGLGQTAANHLLQGLAHFPAAVTQRLTQADFTPQFDLDAALEAARQITQRDDADAHLDN
ncbi:MAG: NAD(P)H-dependent oxidoreductase subunit E [Nitrosomonas sp.]|nr:NAD(P)H-dependent oxidoreductase subunit E [Nitrosomonas sp.]MDP1950456.1 NAD(P)H-dependent oxidoreductase subunit E [Nitrosomonas sp.]